MVVEVMGRNAGWIATISGIAGGADDILIPEVPFDLDEVAKHLRARCAAGKMFSIVVVAEGARPRGMEGAITQSSKTDAFGHVRLGGVGNFLRDELEKRLDMETRVTVLGHVQRGGTPTAYDRVLATRFGVRAVELVAAGDFGKMVALRGNAIVPVPLEEALGELKTVDMEVYEISKIFFGG
ncbi:6-phosphofructokinase [hydrocarbon metagenome]|uniref:6-phosphofructokinase n=1 Tax=hydrocarbon metagenome TaxID=938273 RepID=A0A0W8FEK6_9ZZZZ